MRETRRERSGVTGTKRIDSGLGTDKSIPIRGSVRERQDIGYAGHPPHQLDVKSATRPRAAIGELREN